MCNFTYDRLAKKCEVSTVAKGLVYIMYPPYNKESIWDPSKQEWKKHFYIILTDPNFQGDVQVMQLTSQYKGDLPISLPIKMSINDKNGYVRCDAIYKVHFSSFKNPCFRGVYSARGAGLPPLEEFVQLCIDFYAVINQIVAPDSPQGIDTLKRVAAYEDAYAKIHEVEYEPDFPFVSTRENWSSLATKEYETSRIYDLDTLADGCDVTEEDYVQGRLQPDDDDDEITQPAKIREEVKDETKEEKAVITKEVKEETKEETLEEKPQKSDSQQSLNRFKNPSFQVKTWTNHDLVLYYCMKEVNGIDYIKNLTGLDAKRIYSLNHSIKNEGIGRGLLTRKGMIIDQETHDHVSVEEYYKKIS